MQDFQKRVIEERDELHERLVKLTDFIGGDMWPKLPRDEQARLLKQQHLMADYRDVLNERIAVFS